MRRTRSLWDAPKSRFQEALQNRESERLRQEETAAAPGETAGTRLVQPHKGLLAAGITDVAAGCHPMRLTMETRDSPWRLTMRALYRDDTLVISHFPV